MKEINLFIKNKNIDSKELVSKLSKFLKVSEVFTPEENTLIIEEDHFVDWSYISRFGLAENTEFVFLHEFFENNFQRDEYTSSGIRYMKKSGEDFVKFPLVKYHEEPSSLTPVLFLDRDGIINEDSGYVYEYSDSIIFKDMIEVVKEANKLKIPVIIVTNQAGVARGMYSLEDVDSFHKSLVEYYASLGAVINHIEICPFHKDKGNEAWKFDSLLRKPNPGMHLKALAAVGGTFSNSLMIGDKESDRIKIPGLKSLLLSGNYEMSSGEDVCVSRQELCEKISKYLNNLLDLS